MAIATRAGRKAQREAGGGRRAAGRMLQRAGCITNHTASSSSPPSSRASHCLEPLSLGSTVNLCTPVQACAQRPRPRRRTAPSLGCTSPCSRYGGSSGSHRMLSRASASESLRARSRVAERERQSCGHVGDDTEVRCSQPELQLLGAICRLWVAGVSVDWPTLNQTLLENGRRRLAEAEDTTTSPAAMGGEGGQSQSGPDC